ncbi:MAG: site-2 protease family protein [Clostridium sp.]
MHFRNLHVRISLLWLPYLLLLPYLRVARLIGWIFIMLTLHEMAHIACAILFRYPIERINIYPFGLAATITHIGHGSLVKEILIISAGPLMHVLFPSLFQFCVAKGILSPSFASYLHTINASILLFNLLPIYPLDGGRLMQTFFTAFYAFVQRNMQPLFAPLFPSQLFFTFICCRE